MRRRSKGVDNFGVMLVCGMRQHFVNKKCLWCTQLIPQLAPGMLQWRWLEEIFQQESSQLQSCSTINTSIIGLTNMPNVQAVKPIFTAAVTISKNTFSITAFGLENRYRNSFLTACESERAYLQSPW